MPRLLSLSGLLLMFLVFWIWKAPGQAASVFVSIGHTIGSVFAGFGSFLSGLAG